MSLNLPVVNTLWGTLLKPPAPSGKIDLLLALPILALALFGWIMVTSASVDIDATRLGDGWYHSKRHGLWLLIGTAVLLLTRRIPLAWWERHGARLLAIAIVLLALVLVPGIGRKVNGSMRWIGFGSVTVQVSEIAKAFILIYLSGYLVRHRAEVQQRWTGFLNPMLILGVVIFLLISEPDFGAVVVLMSTVLGLFFLAGMAVLRFCTLILGSIGVGALLLVAQPYRLNRMKTYIDPWADQFNSGYQLTQALIAFGRGEWFGLGLGNSIQKVFYLPEAHTDFVFAVIAEELGLVGGLMMIALFVMLVWRGLLIARNAEREGRLFGSYLAYGVSLMLAIQVLINLGVNTGLLPTKGLTLPLISYGGSSVVVTGFMLALLLRVEAENSPATRTAEADA